MSSQTHFHHQPLHSSTSIRLLELLPDKPGSKVECKLRTAELDLVPSYEALSYVWGDENDQSEILCDGNTMLIPRNLANGLRCFRDSAVSRVLWADSICINQMDIIEKSYQVRLMGQIYATATRVLIWLGEDNDGSMAEAVECVNFFATLFSHYSEIKDFEKSGFEGEAFLRTGTRNFDTIRTTFGLFPEDSSKYKALKTFTHNPWFYRAWTFQESFLARKRQLYLGKFMLHDIRLQQALLMAELLYRVTNIAIFREINNRDCTTMIAPKYQLIGPKKFRQLMWQRKGSGCKHSVDLVYSLLDTTTDILEIVPDYSKNYVQVFTEATLAIMRMDKGLAILADVAIAPRNNSSELPSWVPDWRVKQPNFGLLRTQAPLFSCTGENNHQCSIISDGRKLTVRGFEIDQIHALDDFRAGHELLQTHLPVEGDSQQCLHTTGESRRIAVIRTICCDLVIFDEKNILKNAVQRYDESPEELLQDMSSLGQRWKDATGKLLQDILDQYHPHYPSDSYVSFLQKYTTAGYRRKFIVTKHLRLGLAPENAEPGDVVTILFGSQVPVLLRPSPGKDNEYLFVGLCYVDQMMDGQALREAPEQECPDKSLEEPSVMNQPLLSIRDFVII